MLTLGAVDAAQKLLVASLGVLAFTGGYLLVSDLVDRVGRLASGAVYMLGAIGYSGVRQGALGALVFGAVAPFVLRSMVRLCGWSRPPGWNRGISVARIGLVSAISAAFVPGSLLLYLMAAVLLSAARSFFVPGERARRAFASCALGLSIGLVLCLPWASTWLAEGGPLSLMRDDATWRGYASSFEGHGMSTVLLGQTPEAPVFFGVALAILGVLAVVISSGQRRRFSLALWSLIVATGVVVTLFRGGVLRPFVASPTEAGVLASLAFAGLAGVAVGAFRLDLPRRGFGWIQWASLGGFAAAAVLLVAGLGPALLRGDWDPDPPTNHQRVEVIAQVGTLLAAEAEGEGQFRALWVGDGWGGPVPTSARPTRESFLTGPRGQVLSDLFERPDLDARAQLDRVISSIESGSTDRGGALLGTFNIHYVVLERANANEAWLSQRDLGIVRSEEVYLLLENQGYLARAATYDELPARLQAVNDNDPLIAAGDSGRELEQLQEETSYSYSDDEVRGPAKLFLAEAASDMWTATLDGAPLERIEGGWGNAFAIPDASGELDVAAPRTIGTIAMLVLVLLVWTIVLAASFPRKAASRRRAAQG